jgi:hypothetical protein
MKKCLACNQIKSSEEWSKCLSRRDGLSTQCKSCQKKHYQKNKEKRLLQKKKYYLDNIEKIKIKSKEKYNKNKEKIVEKVRIYRQKNKKSINEKRQKKYNFDIAYRLKIRLRIRLGHFVKNKSKTGILLKYLGLSKENYIKYLESKFSDGMTWENYGHGDGKWCIDHVIPLCHFDFEDDRHILLASHYTNTQPMWFKENGILGSKKDWVQKENFISWAQEILRKNKFDIFNK